MNLNSGIKTSIKKQITSGVLVAKKAAKLMSDYKVEKKHFNAYLVDIAKDYSVAPISNFYVGAVVESEVGDYYLGANYEFEDSFLNQSIHAEQSALVNAYFNNVSKIRSISVNYLPCGHCRQFLEEVRKTDDFMVSVTDQIEMPLDKLLPHAIGPEALGVNVKFFDRKRDLSSITAAANLEDIARSVAEHNSYTPYTKLEAAAVIKTTAGGVVWGVAIENMAFNPSLTPMHCALSQLRFFRPNEISEVIIFQKKHPLINIVDTAKILIKDKVDPFKIKVVVE